MARGTTRQSLTSEIDALLREAKLTTHADLPLAGEGEYDTVSGWCRRLRDLDHRALKKIVALLVSRGEAETGVPGVEVRNGSRYRTPGGLIRSATLARLAGGK